MAYAGYFAHVRDCSAVPRCSFENGLLCPDGKRLFDAWQAAEAAQRATLEASERQRRRSLAPAGRRRR